MVHVWVGAVLCENVSMLWMSDSTVCLQLK